MNIFSESSAAQSSISEIIHKNALWGKREDTRYGESSLPRLCHLCRLRVSDIEEDKEEDFLTTFVRHFREGIIERRR